MAMESGQLAGAQHVNIKHQRQSTNMLDNDDNGSNDNCRIYLTISCHFRRLAEEFNHYFMHKLGDGIRLASLYFSYVVMSFLLVLPGYKRPVVSPDLQYPQDGYPGQKSPLRSSGSAQRVSS